MSRRCVGGIVAKKVTDMSFVGVMRSIIMLAGLGCIVMLGLSLIAADISPARAVVVWSFGLLLYLIILSLCSVTSRER
jgi:hypothetical protein